MVLDCNVVVPEGEADIKTIVDAWADRETIPEYMEATLVDVSSTTGQAYADPLLDTSACMDGPCIAGSLAADAMQWATSTSCDPRWNAPR